MIYCCLIPVVPGCYLRSRLVLCAQSKLTFENLPFSNGGVCWELGTSILRNPIITVDSSRTAS